MNKFIFIFSLFFSSFIFAGEGTFLVLSDLHYNHYDNESNYPIYQRGDGDHHNDTNLFYLEKVMAAIKLNFTRENRDDPDFIIITGDIFVHQFKEKCQKQYPEGYDPAKTKDIVRRCAMETIGQVKKTIKGTFGDVSIFPVMGNNDSDSGNYSIYRGFIDDFYLEFDIAKHLDEENDPYKKVKSAGDYFKSTGGAYTVLLPPGNKVKLMALNTVIFAVKDKLKCKEKSQTATKETCKIFKKDQENYVSAYLKANESAEPSIVIGHIPPSQSLGMRADKVDNFERLTKYASGKIPHVIAGHYHRNIRFSLNGENDVSSVGSITYRIAGDNVPAPEFNVFDYDRESGSIDQQYRCVLVKDIKKVIDASGTTAAITTALLGDVNDNNKNGVVCEAPNYDW